MPKLRKFRPSKRKFNDLTKEMDDYYGDKSFWRLRDNTRNYGRKFIEEFRHQFIYDSLRRPQMLLDLRSEPVGAPVSMCVLIPWKKVKDEYSPRDYHPNIVCSLALDFGKDLITAKEIQGGFGMYSQIKELEKLAGKNWKDFLMDEFEKRAREFGFKYARISVPETLISYEDPVVAYSSKDIRYLEKVRNMEHKGLISKRQLGTLERRHLSKLNNQVRERMRKLYYNIAKARGYKKQGRYFVKRL